MVSIPMTMRARLGIALFAGLLLGLIVVGSAVYSPYHQAGAPVYLIRFGVYSTADARGQSGSPDGTGKNDSTQYMNGSSNLQPVFATQLASLGSQPPAVSAVVLLPVLTGGLFGLILYRASAAKNEDESPRAS